jgi:RNase P subunit RPR2
MTEKVEMVVACIPVHLVPDIQKVADYSTYEKVECPGCHKLMWLGAQGKEMLKQNGVMMRCMICLVQNMIAHGKTPNDMEIITLIDPKRNPH